MTLLSPAVSQETDAKKEVQFLLDLLHLYEQELRQPSGNLNARGLDGICEGIQVVATHLHPPVQKIMTTENNSHHRLRLHLSLTALELVRVRIADDYRKTRDTRVLNQAVRLITTALGEY